jgi:hypothetical protein
MNAVLSLFSFRFGGTAVKQACPTCHGNGTGWTDPEQPTGFQSTAGFAKFVDEPQSPALLEPKPRREVTTN